jgi:hypothetical protein
MAGRLMDILSSDDSGKQEPKSDTSTMQHLKDIVAAIFAPRANQPLSAENLMMERRRKLDQMGGGNPGGAFDIIYKKTKEKNDALDKLRDDGL